MPRTSSSLASMGRTLASSTTGANAGATLDIAVTFSGEQKLNNFLGFLERIRTSADVKELDTLGRRLHNLNQDLNGFAVASGLGFAAFTAGGIKAADQMKVFHAQFKALTGSEAQANEMLQRMIKLSTDLKLPLSDVMQTSGQIAANLKLNGQDINRLDEAVTLIQRASLLKVPGSGGPAGPQNAAIALTEALQGQYRSLQTRLGISPDVFRDFLSKANGDKLKAFDMLLNDLGFTTSAAAEANQTFSNSIKRLQDSLGMLAATTMQPLLDDLLLPMIDGFTKFNQEFAQSSPHIARVTTSLTLMGLALPVVARGALGVYETFARLRAILLSSEGLGKSGLGGFIMSLLSPAALGVGASVLAGGILGGLLSGPVSQAVVGGKKGDTKVVAPGFIAQNISGSSPDEILARFLEFFKVLIALGPQAAKVFVTLGDTLVGFFLLFTRRFGTWITSIGEIVSKLPGMEKLGEGIQKLGKGLEQGSIKAFENTTKASQELKNQLDDATLALYGVERASGDSTTALGKLQQEIEAMGDEQLKIFQKYKDEVLEEEKDLRDDLARLQLERDKDQARSSADYNRSIRRAQEDFDREEQQRQKDLADRVSDIRNDGANQERQLTIDSQRRITEIQEDFRQNEIERLAEHQKEMRRMEEDHQHNLEEAASRLDAIAIVKEMFTYNRNRSRAEEDFADETGSNKRQLKQRIVEERQHYRESIQQLRQSNEEKIQELVQNAARETIQRKEDFANKLKDMADQHTVEMKRIQQDFLDKQRERQAQHVAEIEQLRQNAAENIAASLGLQRAGQQASLDELALFWAAVRDQFATQGQEGTSTGTGGGSTPRIPHDDDDGPGGRGGYASGTTHVGRTGMYKLHEGEVIFDPVRGAAYRSMINNPRGTVNNRNSKQVEINMPISMSGITDGDSVLKIGVPAIRKVVTQVIKEALS